MSVSTALTPWCGSIASASISRCIATPLEQQAKNAFFFHYVTNDLQTYSYLQSFSLAASSVKHLSASVDAVSLAFFSHWANSQIALDRAKECYLVALELTSEAIKNPATASDDATLLTSLLLDLFEKMTNRVPHWKDAWMSHVNGAFSLVQLRGQDQLSRPLGIQLLVRLCNNLLISRVVSHEPVPQEFTLLRSVVADYVDSSNPKWRLGGLMVRFVELRQVAKSQSILPCDIIELANGLDSDLCTLVDYMPPLWQYETVFIKEDSPRVLGSSYHVFRDVHVTQTWNVLRLARILINEIVLNQRSRLFSNSTSSFILDGVFRDHEAAEESIRRIAVDICASVPQYTNFSTSILAEDRVGSEKQNRMRCYTLLFPLFVAAQSGSTLPTVREWIIMQLRHMVSELNVRNAELVLNILSHGDWVEPWSVYAMLGGYAFVA